MKIKILERFDYLLILSITILCSLGILFIYSSGINSDGILVSMEYRRQIIWFSIGFVIMILLALLDYRKFKKYSLWAYLFLIAALIFTILKGKEINGAKSWLGIGRLGIQPAELGKILYILFLANYMDKSKKVNPAKRYSTAMMIMLLPVGLILKQPDLGTASVYIPIFIFMCYMAEIPLRYIMATLITGILAIIFTVLPVWHTQIWLANSSHTSISIINVLTNTKLLLAVIAITTMAVVISLLGYLFTKKKYYYWIIYGFAILTIALTFSIPAGKVLKNYQIQRLIIFIDPYTDRLGAGWNIIQSITAIGSGGFLGRGFLNGTQSHLRFLPEQSTDFIFSIFSEEAGFVGGIIVFSIFFTIFMRIIKIMRNTTSSYGYYIASGILGMLFFHFCVNVGMVMGVMPITGIPLPFLSYGGSALLTNMVSMGLLMSIKSRRLDFNANIL